MDANTLVCFSLQRQLLPVTLYSNLCATSTLTSTSTRDNSNLFYAPPTNKKKTSKSTTLQCHGLPLPMAMRELHNGKSVTVLMECPALLFWTLKQDLKLLVQQKRTQYWLKARTQVSRESGNHGANSQRSTKFAASRLQAMMLSPGLNTNTGMRLNAARMKSREFSLMAAQSTLRSCDISLRLLLLFQLLSSNSNFLHRLLYPSQFMMVNFQFVRYVQSFSQPVAISFLYFTKL